MRTFAIKMLSTPEPFQVTSDITVHCLVAFKPKGLIKVTLVICGWWSLEGEYVFCCFCRQSYEVSATQGPAASLFHFFQQAATNERSEVRGKKLFVQNGTPNYDANLQVFAVS